MERLLYQAVLLQCNFNILLAHKASLFSIFSTATATCTCTAASWLNLDSCTTVDMTTLLTFDDMDFTSHSRLVLRSIAGINTIYTFRHGAATERKCHKVSGIR